MRDNPTKTETLSSVSRLIPSRLSRARGVVRWTRGKKRTWWTGERCHVAGREDAEGTVDGVSGAAPGSALRDVCVRSGDRKLVPDQPERLSTAGYPFVSTRGAVSPISVRIKNSFSCFTSERVINIVELNFEGNKLK